MDGHTDSDSTGPGSGGPWAGGAERPRRKACGHELAKSGRILRSSLASSSRPSCLTAKSRSWHTRLSSLRRSWWWRLVAKYPDSSSWQVWRIASCTASCRFILAVSSSRSERTRSNSSAMLSVVLSAAPSSGRSTWQPKLRRAGGGGSEGGCCAQSGFVGLSPRCAWCTEGRDCGRGCLTWLAREDANSDRMAKSSSCKAATCLCVSSPIMSVAVRLLSSSSWRACTF
mmetsp:Transcript_53290/g.167540  ORF Transcript_53290/g.167540 Transcript_53290/m.167540 type:complete len:228 (-) Transcript_53290:1037-1720(-)